MNLDQEYQNIKNGISSAINKAISNRNEKSGDLFHNNSFLTEVTDLFKQDEVLLKNDPQIMKIAMNIYEYMYIISPDRAAINYGLLTDNVLIISKIETYFESIKQYVQKLSKLIEKCVNTNKTREQTIEVLKAFFENYTLENDMSIFNLYGRDSEKLANQIYDLLNLDNSQKRRKYKECAKIKVGDSNILTNLCYAVSAALVLPSVPSLLFLSLIILEAPIEMIPSCSLQISCVAAGLTGLPVSKVLYEPKPDSKFQFSLQVNLLAIDILFSSLMRLKKDKDILMIMSPVVIEICNGLNFRGQEIINKIKPLTPHNSIEYKELEHFTKTLEYLLNKYQDFMYLDIYTNQIVSKFNGNIHRFCDKLEEMSIIINKIGHYENNVISLQEKLSSKRKGRIISPNNNNLH